MSWTVTEGIEFEVACETITHMIALHIEAIWLEERKLLPDTARIAVLDAACLRLADERRSLRPNHRDQIKRVFDTYGPIIRANLGTTKG